MVVTTGPYRRYVEDICTYEHYKMRSTVMFNDTVKRELADLHPTHTAAYIFLFVRFVDHSYSKVSILPIIILVWLKICASEISLFALDSPG